MSGHATLTKKGTHTLEQATTTGLIIMDGSISVNKGVKLVFSHLPDFVISASPGRDIPIPPGTAPAGAPWTVNLSKDAQTSLWWTTEVSPTPQPPTPVNCVVGPWGPWSDWTPISPTLESRTRTRPITVPPANGGAACPNLIETETRPIQSPEPPDPTRRLLKSTDLHYLGMLRVDDKTPMDFAYGQMSGRVVDGQTRLFLTGNAATLHDPVFEFADPGTYGATPETAPRMVTVRAWGDIYHDKRTSWDDAGNEIGVQSRRMGGLYWHEGLQLLYWTYLNTYNVSHYNDWSLGASSLNDADGSSVAYGPWRPEGVGTTKMGPWICTRVAQAPDGQMLCGATLSSGNAGSPWGPDLWSGAFPTQTTPGAYGAPNIPVDKYLTYYYMGSTIDDAGMAIGPLMSSRRPGNYFFEPFPNTIRCNIDPAKNNGLGSWSELDYWMGVTWIDIPNRYGVLFSGVFAAGHEWYSSGLNNSTCTHGVPSPIQITGPVSTEVIPTLWIYDPTDLAAVRAGTKVDYTVDPTETIDAASVYGLITAPIGSMGSAGIIAGQYFDAVARKLYVVAPEADKTIGGYALPLIHVFQVN